MINIFKYKKIAKELETKVIELQKDLNNCKLDNQRLKVSEQVIVCDFEKCKYNITNTCTKKSVILTAIEFENKDQYLDCATFQFRENG
jgi:hypothetical protein